MNLFKRAIVQYYIMRSKVCQNKVFKYDKQFLAYNKKARICINNENKQLSDMYGKLAQNAIDKFGTELQKIMLSAIKLVS